MASGPDGSSVPVAGNPCCVPATTMGAAVGAATATGAVVGAGVGEAAATGAAVGAGVKVTEAVAEGATVNGGWVGGIMTTGALH